MYRMALKTLVIVNSISNLSDARYCAGMGVDMLGFNLDASSPGYLEPQTFKVINEWVAGVKKVGELSKAESGDLENVMADYALDYLQIMDSGNWQALHSAGIPLICKVSWENHWTLTDFEKKYALIVPYVDFFIIEIASLTNEVLGTIRQVAALYPVLLGCNDREADIENLLSEINLKGLALKGSHEIRPGLKDFDQLAQILEQLETDE
jgi:phosphoribosylanthranilate isomerase